MTPAPDQLHEFARRYTDAWCSQDPARVAENYAPDGSLTINDGAPSVGRAAITEAARSFMVAFPDMQVLMDDLVVHETTPNTAGRSSERTQAPVGRGAGSRSTDSRSGRSETMASSIHRSATMTRLSTTARSSMV